MKFFSVFLALGLTFSLNAQIIKKTEDKAKKKTNQRVDQKIDNQLDKGLDAIEGMFKKKKKDNPDNQDDSFDNTSPAESESFDMSQMNGLMGMMNTVEINKSYSFDENFKLKMENFKKDKLESEITMTMYLNDQNDAMGMKLHGKEGENIDFMVYDIKEKQMLTMMTSEGNKMGMVISTDQPATESQESESIGEITFTKTGNSKTISGYSCDEYEVEYSEPNSEKQFFWITTDTDADWIKSMGQLSKQNPQLSANYMLPDSYPEGSIIQIVQFTDNKDEKNIVTVEEINVDENKSFSTSGYSFMAMPAAGKQ